MRKAVTSRRHISTISTKRKTRATDAQAKGLAPLAEWLLKLLPNVNVAQEAANYIKEDVPTIQDALQGGKRYYCRKS